MQITDGWLNKNFYTPIYEKLLTSNFSLIPDHKENTESVTILKENLDEVYADAKKFLRDAFNLDKEEINFIIEEQMEIIKTIDIKSNGWAG